MTFKPARLGSAVDKLSLRVPRHTTLNPSFRKRYREELEGVGRPTRYYRRVLDLRDYFGIQAVLHDDQRYSTKGFGPSKLELIDVGGKCYPEWKEVVQQVYEVDPDALEIMQLDLAVDVEAIPIQWFRSHMRYKPNGHFREIGKFDYISGPVETFYLRQKPTFIRVYDKDAETLHRTGSALGRTVTRIEKAYGTGAVPEEIGTLGALRESATKINPFKGIEFAPGGLPSPRIEDHDPDVWALGMGVRAAIEAEGYDRAWNMLNRSKKAGEIFAIAADFIPASEFVPPDLYALYRESVAAQLACPTKTDPLSAGSSVVMVA